MPPAKGKNWGLWVKMLIGGTAISVGGPAFVYWLQPTDEELRSRYNPDLRKRSLEGREERQQDFEDFVTRLKEQSKSDKPIWVVVKEEEEMKRRNAISTGRLDQEAADARREAMRREAGLMEKR